MEYSITFLEEDYRRLTDALFPAAIERAAYLLCGLSTGQRETKLLVREVVPVRDEDIDSASAVHLSIPSRTFTRWFKHADEEKSCLVFVHSHPGGTTEFSPQDNREDPPFFKSAYTRIHREDAVHGSLVLAGPEAIAGRVWSRDGLMYPMSCIRIIGKRFRFIRDYDEIGPEAAFYDRQIRAFGQTFQPVLKRLKVGVVGAGGTGSNVVEQLIRLGVGDLTVIDGQSFEVSNVNRVYGSHATDENIHKTDIAKRNTNIIGLGTTLRAIKKPISFRSSIEALKDCDVVFGCTDDQWGRSLLGSFSLAYLTPVIDMGVAIDSDNGAVDRIEGRVTALLPGTACLYCRRRISPNGVRDDAISQTDPEQAALLRQEGYLVGLDERAPSVVPFTTGIASLAVSELLHRLTGFMGPGRETSEVIYRIDWNRIRTNNTPTDPNCACADRGKWATGDTRPFLGVLWRQEL